MTTAKERIQGVRERLDVAVGQGNRADVIEDTETLCGALKAVLDLGCDLKDWDLVEKVTKMLGALSGAANQTNLNKTYATLTENLDLLEELYTRKPLDPTT